MSSVAELDRTNVVDVDLGSAEFKANAHRLMAEWATRRPFYVLGKGPVQGPVQVVVGRYADVPKVFSDTQTFASEMPRGPGWEQFNKIMDAQFVTQMDGEQHARVRRGVDLQRQVDGLRRFLIVTEGATSKPHLSKLLPPREADCPSYDDY